MRSRNDQLHQPKGEHLTCSTEPRLGVSGKQTQNPNHQPEQKNKHKIKQEAKKPTKTKPALVGVIGWLVASSIFVGSVGCGSEAVMKGQLAGLDQIIKQAKDNGAIRCAPREIAMAESHHRFAQIEIDQGSVFRAKEHILLAQVNAKSAYDMSPAHYCAERGFAVQPKAGDRDGDGYPDSEDKCPDEPENYNGFQDEDGCPDDPDTDSDGVPDSKDACILEPEDKDGYLDEDGCPDPDNDLDGIPDAKDKCPNDPEDPDGFEDEDGCPEPDNDKDGVPDVEDMCPNEPGSPKATKKGCPDNSLVVVTDKEIKILQQIHFEFGRATIRKESYPILDAVADVLVRFPNMKIEVQGHTDNRGSKALNDRLSKDRANSVRTHLIKVKGIDGSRLTAKGYGMDKPLVPNDTDVNRALNRRVQFIRTENQ